MTDPTKPQPPPRAGTASATWDLVLSDIKQRDIAGAQKYGVRHQHDNGRDHLVDAYQEALDMVVYLRAEIEKRANDLEPKSFRQTIKDLRDDLVLLDDRRAAELLGVAPVDGRAPTAESKKVEAKPHAAHTPQPDAYRDALTEIGVALSKSDISAARRIYCKAVHGDGCLCAGDAPKPIACAGCEQKRLTDGDLIGLGALITAEASALAARNAVHVLRGGSGYIEHSSINLDSYEALICAELKARGVLK